MVIIARMLTSYTSSSSSIILGLALGKILNLLLMLFQCIRRHGQELARHALVVAFFLKYRIIARILFVLTRLKIPVGILANIFGAAIVKGASSDLGGCQGSVLFIQLDPPCGD